MTNVILSDNVVNDFCQVKFLLMESLPLIRKYNVPGPRYTSYPTVPFWDQQSFSLSDWTSKIKQAFVQSDGISLYIHLPYCESMCTFCACHKRITKNHSVEKPYISALLKEWKMYVKLLGKWPVIKELHLGGGTPTFFSPQNLDDLLNGIFCMADKTDDYEFSFEGHPNNTTKEHLETLYNQGFRRVSLGVQDYSLRIQQAINRIQPLTHVARTTLWAREIGYTSVSHDLVYGLPFQGVEDVLDTIEKTVSLRPDRLAFYSYAHVPWIKGNGQRGFSDHDVPAGELKRNLYEQGKLRLEGAGYKEIGMDHFALEDDGLYDSFMRSKLHRNFMGYTPVHTRLMIGLGVSAISDCWTSFAQNSKNVEDYLQLIEWGNLPVVKGHCLTDEDQAIRKHILNLMCRFSTEISDHPFAGWDQVREQLHELEKDQLIEITGNRVTVLEKGKPFVRNVCMAFDLRLKDSNPENKLFSMTI
jgi:oxygen-independent coproporphyrinogen III oxidase